MSSRRRPALVILLWVYLAGGFNRHHPGFANSFGWSRFMSKGKYLIRVLTSAQLPGGFPEPTVHLEDNRPIRRSR
jgi:hypothetical protein